MITLKEIAEEYEWMKPGATSEDLFDKAIIIAKTGNEADQAKYLEQLIYFTIWIDPHFSSVYSQNTVMAYEAAKERVLDNMGYWAGYSSSVDTVYKAYGAKHPVFGLYKPTAKEAFEAGKRMGATNGSEELAAVMKEIRLEFESKQNNHVNT